MALSTGILKAVALATILLAQSKHVNAAPDFVGDKEPARTAAAEAVTPTMLASFIDPQYSIPEPVLYMASLQASDTVKKLETPLLPGFQFGPFLGTPQQLAENVANSTATDLMGAAWYNSPKCYYLAGNGNAFVSWFLLIPEWETPYSLDQASGDVRGSLSGNSACAGVTSYSSAALGFDNWGAQNTTTGAAFVTSIFCTAYQMTNVIKATTGNAENIPCVPYDGSADDSPPGDVGNLAWDSYGDGADDPAADGVERRKRRAVSPSSNFISRVVSKSGSVNVPQPKTQADVKDLIPPSLYKPNMTNAEIIKALSGPAK